MKITFYVLLTLLLLNPSVNLIEFDNRFIDFQQFFVYGIVLLLATIKILAHISSKENLNIRCNMIDCLILLFALWFCIRFYFTDIFSFRSEIFIKFSMYMLLYASIKSRIVNTGKAFKLLYTVFSVFSILICTYGILQFFNIIPSNNLFFKMTGLFNNPSSFTNLLCLIFPIVLTGFWLPLKRHDREIKTASLISIFLMIITVFLANERSALLGFMAGLLLVLNKKYGLIYALKKAYNSSKLKPVIICSCLVSTLACVYLIYLIRPRSFAGRFFIYSNTLQIIRNHFMWGIGPGKFESVYNLYQSQYFKVHNLQGHEWQIADNVGVAFNDLLQLFCETGVIGFVFMMIGIAIIVRNYKNMIWENSSLPAIGLICSFFSVIVVSLFSYPLQNFVIMLYVVILVSLLSENTKISLPFQSITFKANRFACAFVGFGSIGLLTGVLFYLGENQVKWKNMVFKSPESAISLQQYRDLYPALQDNGYFLYNYGSEMAADKDYQEGRNILAQAKKYVMDPDVLIYSGDCFLGLNDNRQAEKEYLSAYYMVPKKLLSQYALMQYYHAIKNDDKANGWAEKIIKSEPIVYSADELEIKNQAAKFLTRSCN